MAALFAHIPRPEARAAFVSFSVGLTLMCVKFLAYVLTGSAAIFSDAVESIANVLASGVALYSLVTAHHPADAEHPYGHGKIEFISAGFEGGMILLASIFILIKSVESFAHGHYMETQKLDYGLALVVLAMLINGAVGFYLLRTGRRQGSMTLVADGKHLLSDAYTSIAVLIGLTIVLITKRRIADPITALVVAGYIAWMAIGLLGGASAGLMDKQDVQDERLIREILDSHLGDNGREPRICSYHKLRHRHSGRYLWVDLHIQVPGTLSVGNGHTIASAIEGEIERAAGQADATAHVEPCNGEHCTAHCPIQRPRQPVEKV